MAKAWSVRPVVWLLLGVLSLGFWAACGWGLELHTSSEVERSQGMASPDLQSLLEPVVEDAPFFRAIADAQEKRLRTCQQEGECQRAHFLRGLAALYENQELAAHHFRQVVALQPNTPLAVRSRFWLWFLEVVRAPGNHKDLSVVVTRRLVREIVERELTVGGFDGQPDQDSLNALRQEVALRDKQVSELTRRIAELTKQIEQLKKEAALRQVVEQELKQSEKRVQELTNQLEALRRIDQELKEKTPPTRPSEKMTPVPETEVPAKGSS